MRFFAPRGSYSGRLAFDPESNFHIDPKGRKLVTDDGGLTWRYAKRGDQSHTARYHKAFAVVNATTDADPHHLAPLPDDPHVDGALADPDELATVVTSHTEAYK